MSMLFELTLLVDIFAMAISLWMAFYLFARGFPSRITLRAVVVLLLLSTFFFTVNYDLFHEMVGTVALRAALVIVGLGTWYSLTCHLISVRSRERLRWAEISIYILCGLTAILMLTSSDIFSGKQGSPPSMPNMRIGAPSVLYLFFLLLVSLGIFYNLFTDKRIGLTPQGKYFLLASILIISAVGYGVLAVTRTSPLPRLIMDILILSGLTLLGVSVARHQTLVERRTTLQDFPVSGLAVLGLSALYAFLALRWELPLDMIAVVVAIAILTHSFYDLVREFLERLHVRNESSFRRQLRQLESESFDEEALQTRLQEGLELLCETLKSPGGFIAVRRGENFIVIATQQSLMHGRQLSPGAVACDDVCRPDGNQLSGIVWIAPAFDAKTQIAIVGLSQPRARLDYSASDLDLLAEVADHVGTIISLSNPQLHKIEKIRELATESQANATELNSSAAELMATLTTHPDPEFIKMIEEGLRHLSDSIALGQSPLTDWAKISGESHVERGKKLQSFLRDSIESLRPVGTRPSEPLPRTWYNYAVLYDAYVEGIPNREIMSRLYVSEGTFHRIRRNAVRGLARLTMEKGETLHKSQ